MITLCRKLKICLCPLRFFLFPSLTKGGERPCKFPKAFLTSHFVACEVTFQVAGFVPMRNAKPFPQKHYFSSFHYSYDNNSSVFLIIFLAFQKVISIALEDTTLMTSPHDLVCCFCYLLIEEKILV